jgi:hypothetical protein
MSSTVIGVSVSAVRLINPSRALQAGFATTREAQPDPAALIKGIPDDIRVLVAEDGNDFDVVLSPLEPDHQRLWRHMVEVRVPAAGDLADRLLAALCQGGVNVIRVTEPVRLTLVRDDRDDEVQLDALINAKLAAVHERLFLPSEIVLVLSEGPGDTLP